MQSGEWLPGCHYEVKTIIIIITEEEATFFVKPLLLLTLGRGPQAEYKNTYKSVAPFPPDTPSLQSRPAIRKRAPFVTCMSLTATEKEIKNKEGFRCLMGKIFCWLLPIKLKAKRNRPVIKGEDTRGGDLPKRFFQNFLTTGSQFAP